MYVADDPCIWFGLHFARSFGDLQSPQWPSLYTAANAEHASYATTAVHILPHVVFLTSKHPIVEPNTASWHADIGCFGRQAVTQTLSFDK